MKRLTVEEETRLALAAQRGDQRAKNELFRHHEPLVRWLSKRFYGPDDDELYSAGAMGWVHALRTWRPKGGAGFKPWLTWWVRAYAGRATKVWLGRREQERSLELNDGDDSDSFERSVSDEGTAAEEMVDELWRREAHGIIDGMRDRRLAIVLQQRMRGLSLDEVSTRYAAKIRSSNRGERGRVSRERVRQLEMRAVDVARKLVRA